MIGNDIKKTPLFKGIQKELIFDEVQLELPGT